MMEIKISYVVGARNTYRILWRKLCGRGHWKREKLRGYH
jgi:hypothetical protein